MSNFMISWITIKVSNIAIWVWTFNYYTWEFLVGCAAQFSKSWPCLRQKKIVFHTRFRPGLYEIMPSILRSEQQQKRFLKIHDLNEFAFFSSFFFIWNCTLPLSLENYLISDLNGQSLYPFLDQNNAKPLPSGVAHTYVAYIREYPSGESNGLLTEKVGEHFISTDQWWWRVTYDVIQHRLRKFPLLLI